MSESKTAVRIILFCKYPAPFAVKTRLIPRLGAAGAADLQRRLLLRSADEIRRMTKAYHAEFEVRFAGGSEAEIRMLLGDDLRVTPQGEGDLGARMHRAIAEAVGEGASRVLLTGSDIPALRSEILGEGLQKLDEVDVVLGPAEDGGYYLIGMGRPRSRLFSEIPWGTADVCRLTEERLRREGLSFTKLETLSDLDRPEDLARFSF